MRFSGQRGAMRNARSLAEGMRRPLKGIRGKTYEVVQNLVPDDAHHLKALLAADRVDDHVAVDADKVLRVEDAVLVLAGGVDHLDGEVVVAVADDFAEGVFDGRVVRVDKVAVDVLDCEGGFAWALLEGCGLLV
jgi:hypothetical protein